MCVVTGMSQIESWVMVTSVSPPPWSMILAPAGTDSAQTVTAADEQAIRIVAKRRMVPPPGRRSFTQGTPGGPPVNGQSGDGESNHTAPSGGTRNVADAGWPCQGSGAASTAPRLPTPL